MKLTWSVLASVGLGVALAACSSSSPPPPPSNNNVNNNNNGSALLLNVPSPSWQDQIIYMVMPDRFNDGDPANDNQNANEYDPADGSKYSGGDLKGLAQKLDYIQGLGATTVWITPPVANMWWDPLAKYGGYHGYWANDFKSVDKHMGTLADYQALSDGLHRKGMYLVQDVVVNHMSNCFTYSSYDAADPTKNVVLNTGAVPACSTRPAPWNQFDPSNATDYAANIFHWTPSIADFQDRTQELTYQLSDLDDLNTENPAVVTALKDAFGYWIKTVGVDGFRVDTAFYVPQTFFQHWMYDADGIKAAALSTQRDNFHVFGEGFASDNAYQDVNDKKTQSYITDAGGNPVLPAMLNFPLYRTSTDVFGRGAPPDQLKWRLEDEKAIHGDKLYVMPNFVDNHDVDRYLSYASQPALQQNLLFIMTIPGIPVIWQGTEQGFKEQRGAMFNGGFGSNGADHFDTTSSLYTYIQTIAKLRTDNDVLRRGALTVLRANAAQAGVFAYKMVLGSTTAVVLFNTADASVLVDNLATGITPATQGQGALLKYLYAIPEAAGDVGDAVTDASGNLTLALPGRAGRIYLYTGQSQAVPAAPATVTLAPVGATQTDNFTVSGTVTGATVASVKLVVDGNLAGAQTATVTAGAFSGTVDVSVMFDPNLTHTVTAYADSLTPPVASNTATFTVNLPHGTPVTVDDPQGDDTGPAGHTYGYPTDASYNHQNDILHVEAQTIKTSLVVKATMRTLTRTWNPQNGFDHVAFTIFIQVPGATASSTVMPYQSGTTNPVATPFAWNYRARIHGWSNTMYSAQGAAGGDTPDATGTVPTANQGLAAGTPMSTKAIIQSDASTNTLTFIFPASALGNPSTLSGAKVYLNTWDFDASNQDHIGDGYRGLTPVPTQWEYSGGTGAPDSTPWLAPVDPALMDDITPLTIP